MLINISATSISAPTLTREQTQRLLEFCRSIGATRFSVNFVYIKGEESEKLMNCFYERLSSFSAGKEVLESIEGNGFEKQECWILDEHSLEVILRESGGNILSYDVCNLPEDWLIYIGDTILLQTVTHEREATLRLSNDQYITFKQLGIPHKIGLPEWSGLPEKPIRVALRP